MNKGLKQAQNTAVLWNILKRFVTTSFLTESTRFANVLLCTKNIRMQQKRT